MFFYSWFYKLELRINFFKKVFERKKFKQKFLKWPTNFGEKNDNIFFHHLLSWLPHWIFVNSKHVFLNLRVIPRENFYIWNYLQIDFLHMWIISAKIHFLLHYQVKFYEIVFFSLINHFRWNRNFKSHTLRLFTYPVEVLLT